MSCLVHGFRWMVVRAVVIVVAVLLSSVVVVLPASADLCTSAPAPVSPKAGLPGLFTSTPPSIPSSAPDPFADLSVPIGDVYGYNWQWANYDLGCGNDFLRDPGAVTNTSTGNILLSVADAATAGLATQEQMARTAPMEWLSDPIGQILASLQGPILTQWFPLASLALAVFLAWYAKRTSYQEAARLLAVFVISVALAVFALFLPAVLSKGVDKVVVLTATTTGSVFSSSPIDAVNRESNYRTWLQGNFGDADSKVAKAYGPRLVAATRYSWSDWQRIQQTPAAKKEIDAAKATDFTKIAKSLQTEDPAAYEVFTGRGERAGVALFGIFSVSAMGVFVAIASFMVLVARVMAQALTLVAPIVAVSAVLPGASGNLAKLWDLFTASLLAVFKFTLASGVLTIVLGALQGADMSGIARLFWVIVVTVVGLYLTKPARAFKTLVPGLDPNTSYFKKLFNHVAPALGGGVGGAIGAVVGTAAADDRGAEDRSEPEHPVLDPAPSLAALAAPIYTAYQAPQEASAEVLEPVGFPPEAPSLESAPVAGTVPSLEAAPVAATALPAVEQWPVRPALEAAPAASSGGCPPEILAAYGAEPALPSSEPSSVPEVAGVPDVSVPEVPVAPSSAPSRGGADEVVVIEPTGIYTQTDPGLYHSGDHSDEYLVPVSEREVAADGSEYERVIYHAASEG